MASEGATAVIAALNKVIRYAATLGLGAGILQTSLYNGERRCSSMPAGVVLWWAMDHHQ